MKKIIPIFPVNMVKGKLKISGASRANMNRWFLTLKDDLYDLTIKKPENKLTNRQRRYYFGVVVVMLSDYFGYEKDEMHEALKLEFNPIPNPLRPGTMIGGSTNELLRDKYFGDEQSYVNRIRRWAATEHGVNIPDPEKISVDNK